MAQHIGKFFECRAALMQMGSHRVAKKMRSIPSRIEATATVGKDHRHTDGGNGEWLLSRCDVTSEHPAVPGGRTTMAKIIGDCLADMNRQRKTSHPPDLRTDDLN